jgi:hypothetical protein
MKKVFISHRREDTQATAGRIYDKLQSRFGADAIFFDIDNIPLGVDFRDHVIEDTPLRIGAFMGPVAPTLVVGHERRMLLIHARPLRAAHDIGSQQPALDRKATFGQVGPGMARGDRRPVHRELFKTGRHSHEHRSMVTDEALRCAL